ncbi:MAG TPA: hypothetical protein QF683_21130 [SAR324 cluster bacterium]|jgi:hypothetical protein|nr:hypothetical protein [SAR324 cluster bacterium]
MLLFFSPGCAPKEESSSDTSGGGGSTTTYHTLQLNVSGLGGIIIVSSRGGNGNVYNKSEAMAVTSNGTHNFSGIPSGTSYNVTILQQPLYQTCTVSNGSGTLNGNQTVAISCDGTVTIGGKVYGLNGTITLQNNAGNDLTISSNGNFVFTDNLSMGSSYLVTVASQPANGPTCTPNNNSGVATDNITSVEIICSQTLRSISGSINHLSGTLVLQNNFGGDQTFTSNDNFTFNVADNSSYNVTVKSQPAGKCIVSNGTGTASDNVSNVSVDCWVIVDGGNSSDGINYNNLKNADNVTLYSFQSKLYAGWTESSSYGSVTQVRIKRFDNSSSVWETADYNGISMEGSRDSNDLKLLDNGSDFYGVWVENNYTSPYTPSIRVAKFDNETLTWVKYISYSAISDNLSKSPDLGKLSSGIYAIWSEYNGSKQQIRVKKFDGNNSWSVDNASLNDNLSEDALNPTMESFNNKLYAIWQESNGSVKHIRVASTDGNSWENSMLLNKDSTKIGSNPDVVSFNSKLYAAWSETNASGHTQIRIKSSSNGTTWTSVDGDNASKGINKDYRNNATHPKLVVANSNLYAVWLEENGSTQVRVAQFDNSSSWIFKDGDGFDGLNVNTAKVTGNASAAEYNNQLYVAWSETNDTSTTQIRVARAPF